ncbi:MAG: hypothetical protein ABIZ91_06905 [Gemmatimonadaceae bacterium]
MISFRRALVLMSLLVVAACRSAPRETAEQVEATTPPAATPAATTGGSAATGAPVITSLVPDQVRLAANTISEIVVHGTGFAPTGSNIVHVGPIVLRDVPANAAGTEIRVVVPARYTSNAEAPPRPLFPGSYPVQVESRGLMSNSVMVKVTS